MLGIVVFGVMAYRLLPVSDLPNIDFPTIQVTAGLPGASPETIASAVALPLEKQFATIAGVTSINSASNPDSTTITIQFDLSRNIDAAAQDVQAMIAKAARQLPPQMPAPPSLQKVNPADQPVLMLGLNSPVLPLSLADEYAQTLTQRISMVNGVASVTIAGSQKYAVRIDVDPRQLASHGIGLDEVANAVAGANVNLPTGTMYGADQTYMLQANGQLFRAAGYAPMIIAYRNGNPVTLGQVARVYDGVENDKVNARSETEGASPVRSLNFSIQKQPGTNTVAVVDAVKELLPTFRAQLPRFEELILRWDRSEAIRASVRDVKFTLGLTVVLVVLVIFLFLRNISATLIPSLALPTSILATFAVMYQLGYSLDNLSLMALTLSVGFVVDDAIVMLENIVRHMEMGKNPMAAAFDGSKEVAFTIVSMTLSLTAVFIPVLFMGGIVGRLLHEFAVTIGVAILVSGFVSISLTPMLCSRFLKPPHATTHGRVYNAFESLFDGALGAYDWTLRQSLRFHAVTMALSLLLLVGTGYLFTRIPKGFLPTEDTGRLNVSTEAVQGTTLPDMLRYHEDVSAILRSDPNIHEFDTLLGLGGGTLNQGRVLLFLKARADRKLSADQLMTELRPKLSRVLGLRTFMSNPPPISIGGLNTRSQYQFTLQDTDTEELYRSAAVLEERMRRIPGMQDVSTDMQVKNPQLRLDLNRNKIAALGLTVNQIETALYNAYGTRQVSTIYAPNNQYQVIMQVAPEYQRDPSALSMIYVRSPAGLLVPLNTVATVGSGFGALTVNHVGQLPSVTVSFNLGPGFALGDAVAAVQTLAAQALPSTISTSFQGTAQAFQDSLRGLGLILVMAIVVIYLVLGILYESFTHPLTILSGLPSAGFGALAALMIFHTELSVYAFVGVIMLVGLVKKNGIMMVDFAVAAEREEGLTPAEAIHRACLVRFRPIMMTTMAALVGTVPIALGYGAGAESRRPLGIAVVGGLLVSQLLTLYITPVYYMYIENARLWVAGLTRSQGAPAPGPLPG
jgi:HAE1 family hydrophobic/amphiphilic exporter-1